MTKPRRGINLICGVCGNEYYVPKYRAEISKFCSILCQNHKQYEEKRFRFNCSYCGILVTTSPSRVSQNKKFCSKGCWENKTQNRRQISREAAAKRRLQYKSISSKALRKIFFNIYPKECVVCKYNEYDFCIDIHHIDGDPVNNNIENLIALCVICHKKLHKKIIFI